MIYSLSHYWFWLFAIFVCGLATALLTRQAEKSGRISPWLIWCGLAFGLGLLMALLNVLVGRGGVWLETGLAAFASFIVGAGAGVVARGGALGEHRNWALGLIPCIFLWFVGNIFGLPRIEDGLKQAVGGAIKNAGGDAQNFSVDGRDILLPNSIPDRAALAKVIGKMDGVRLVTGTDWLFSETPVAASVADSAETPKAENPDGAGRKGDLGWTDPGKRDYGASGAAPESEGKATEKNLRTSRTTPRKKVASWADGGRSGYPSAKQADDSSEVPSVKRTPSARDKTKTSIALLKSLPPTGALDKTACQAALDATQVLDKVEFRSGGVSIHRASAYVLDSVAALLQRCPDAKAEIGGHTDNVGDDNDNRALSQRRADRVAKYLTDEGVAADRLTAIGYGAQKPIASNDDEDGRSKNRRIEFILK